MNKEKKILQHTGENRKRRETAKEKKAKQMKDSKYVKKGGR
jgi:hypothetical protein